MKTSFLRKIPAATLPLGLLVLMLAALSQAQQISLQALVTPSTVISKDGKPVQFAIHGFIEFNALAETFPYIETQTRRWPDNPAVDDARRQQLGRDLVREAVESRVISMADERPLETLLTHTSDELRNALAAVKGPVPASYGDAFLAVQLKWKHAINCWSASPSIPARVLSNWYPIEEGIQLYGATYDSTEHFWQAVKFHPEVTAGDLSELLGGLAGRDWSSWLARLDSDPNIYLPNAYAVEFLRHNLTPERLRWFADELKRHKVQDGERARQAQQRGEKSLRFAAFEEKVLWGDLADVLHLVYHFAATDDRVRKTLAEHHFDAIYLGERRFGFISEEYRSLMLEIWRVKFLQMPRFREVLRSIAIEVRLEHFLNDGDSPDIPIPIYVGYLNQMRELARAANQP